MIIFFFIAILLSVVSSHPWLMFSGLVTIFIIYKLFWVPQQPKAIFFGLLMFWLTIIIKLFYADLYGLRFEDLSISRNIIQTAYVSLIALLVFALGIYIIISKKVYGSNYVMPDFNNYSTNKVIILYVASVLFKTVLSTSFVMGLGEIIKALVALRGCAMFILIYIYYKKHNNLGIPLLLICIEMGVSLFSYFANFKDVLILFIVIFTYFKIELNFKQILLIVLVGGSFLYFMLLWQSIKGDYRAYLSGGVRSQTIVVNRSDAMAELYRLALNAKFDDPDLLYGSIDRLSYIEFFSEATDNVPATIPYTNGSLWADNIIHILVPRILDPEKKAIFDSDMVNKYATRKVAGADTGTSFSLGFLAESYIDFGYLFMYIPVFLLGILFGLIYRYIIIKSVNYMWGCAMVAPLWVNFQCNGTPGAKILGWLVMYFIVFLLANRYVIPYLEDFISIKKSNK